MNTKQNIRTFGLAALMTGTNMTHHDVTVGKDSWWSRRIAAPYIARCSCGWRSGSCASTARAEVLGESHRAAALPIGAAR